VDEGGPPGFHSCVMSKPLMSSTQSNKCSALALPSTIPDSQRTCSHNPPHTQGLEAPPGLLQSSQPLAEQLSQMEASNTSTARPARGVKGVGGRGGRRAGEGGVVSSRSTGKDGPSNAWSSSLWQRIEAGQVCELLCACLPCESCSAACAAWER